MFLHGAGERGNDNVDQVNLNIDNLLDAAIERNAYLYAPQTSLGWTDSASMTSIMGLIDTAISEQSVDANRVYVTGLSMGGGGTWNALSQFADRFAAAVPIAAVSPSLAFNPDAATGKPIWAFHARDDSVVSVGATRNVVNRLNSAAGEPTVDFPDSGNFKFEDEANNLQYTEWSTGGHAIWNRVYDSVEMYDWMFAQDLSGTTLEPVALNGSGATYQQSFDTLGPDGTVTGGDLPMAWTHGRYGTKVTDAFPIGERTPSFAVFNAGAEGDPDRSLAMGVTNSTDDHFLQFSSTVAESDATSLRLQFAIEAWDSRDGIFVPLINRYLAEPDNPGEAAFQVAIEIDSGNGFESFEDFGTITTGSILSPMIGSVRDGNDPSNRLVFDSGEIDGNIPEGSDIRIRWHTAPDAQTEGWVIGLDDVVFSLSSSDTRLGDFNGNGELDVLDLDLISAEIGANSADIRFDLDGNGEISEADRIAWVTDVKSTFFGDANLDGKVDRSDLNALGANWLSTTATSWSEGDFDGDGVVASSDLNYIGANWQSGNAAAATVPEPTQGLVLVGLLLALSLIHI